MIIKSDKNSDNQWQSQSFLSRHWDAALFGTAAVVSFATPEFGLDPRLKSVFMCGGVVFMLAEQFLFEKTRHTIAKSLCVVAMMGSVAFDVYQSPTIQQQIKPNSPPEIAPPTRA
jgi:hypothetical protein